MSTLWNRGEVIRHMDLSLQDANLEADQMMVAVQNYLKRTGREEWARQNQYTYSQVTKITNNFRIVLGKGGFGVVYHGVMKDQQQVAVKMVNRASIYDIKQFTAEVQDLLTIRHKNLVSLIGYCDEDEHLALIYEFMDQKITAVWLSCNVTGKFAKVLSWEIRMKISVGVAQGLEYLHSRLEKTIHRYVKPTNILLDRNFEPKLADYVLSRSSPTDPETYASNKIYLNPGKSGYLDPEYFSTNWLNYKSDIYSFGIVLLEMITNQPVINNKRESPLISEWVEVMLMKTCSLEMVDPELNNNFETSTVWKALEMALACAHNSSSERPSMSRVVMELNECLSLEMARTHGRAGEITQETQ
ncbi:unnamed protein product [Eruca vesicaria subsp. sativa]|uniref:Protein kinase domain-containing protein n=1 Tax=Eruca vesicaria subsp. sativa TaxID=29727 RepID=A0ABC8LLL3_ERUVS|nr:unnamed protein product [Eruca vesicaria subsp. sativa]